MNEKLWAMLRFQRDRLLASTDKYMLPDFPISPQDRAKYREYREFLRHLPKWYNEDSIHSAKVKTYDEWREWKNGKGEY